MLSFVSSWVLVILAATSHAVPARIVVQEGQEANIPCQGGLRIAGDEPTLVLWYREGENEAIYSYDTGEKSWLTGEHWKETKLLGPRAVFNPFPQPPILTTTSTTSPTFLNKARRSSLEYLQKEVNRTSSSVYIKRQTLKQTEPKEISNVESSRNSPPDWVDDSIEKPMSGFSISNLQKQYKNIRYRRKFFHIESYTPSTRRKRGLASANDNLGRFIRGIAISNGTRGHSLNLDDNKSGEKNRQQFTFEDKHDERNDSAIGIYNSIRKFYQDPISIGTSRDLKSYQCIFNSFKSCQFSPTRRKSHVFKLKHQPVLSDEINSLHYRIRRSDTSNDGRKQSNISLPGFQFAKSTEKSNQYTNRENEKEEELLPLFQNEQENNDFALSRAVGALQLSDINREDHGTYVCRVEYRRAPTSYSSVELFVVLSPNTPQISWRGQKITEGSLGPVLVGSHVHITCASSGGRPKASITWWIAGKQIEGISKELIVSSNETEHKDTFKDVTTGAMKSNPLGNTIVREDKASLIVSKDKLLPSNASSSSISSNTIVLIAERALLNVPIICQASVPKVTPDIKIISRTTAIVLNILLPPVHVSFSPMPDLSEEGKPLEVSCQAFGSHPSATISLWWNGKRLTRIIRTVTDRGNVTTATVKIRPKRSDDGADIVCVVKNDFIDMEAINVTSTVRVSYKPSVRAVQGKNIQLTRVEEGDMVELRCIVDARPPAEEVTWWKDGAQLVSRAPEVSVLGTTLLLSRVAKEQGGSYSCLARNSVGSNLSNVLNLTVLHPPECSEGWQNVSQVAVPGTISQLTCKVDAWPSSHLKVDWSVLSATGKEILIKNGDVVNTRPHVVDTIVQRDGVSDIDTYLDNQNEITYEGSNAGQDEFKRSVRHSSYTATINVTLNYSSEILTVLCRARNIIGIQKTPCRIHLSPTEILPVYQLTSVSGASKESSLNCTSRELEGNRVDAVNISVSCLVTAEIERSFQSYVLQAWKNNSLVWDVSSPSLSWIVSLNSTYRTSMGHSIFDFRSFDMKILATPSKIDSNEPAENSVIYNAIISDSVTQGRHRPLLLKPEKNPNKTEKNEAFSALWWQVPVLGGIVSLIVLLFCLVVLLIAVNRRKGRTQRLSRCEDSHSCHSITTLPEEQDTNEHGEPSTEGLLSARPKNTVVKSILKNNPSKSTDTRIHMSLSRKISEKDPSASSLEPPECYNTTAEASDTSANFSNNFSPSIQRSNHCSSPSHLNLPHLFPKRDSLRSSSGNLRAERMNTMASRPNSNAIRKTLQEEFINTRANSNSDYQSSLNSEQLNTITKGMNVSGNFYNLNTNLKYMPPDNFSGGRNQQPFTPNVISDISRPQQMCATLPIHKKAEAAEQGQTILSSQMSSSATSLCIQDSRSVPSASGIYVQSFGIQSHRKSTHDIENSRDCNTPPPKFDCSKIISKNSNSKKDLPIDNDSINSELLYSKGNSSQSNKEEHELMIIPPPNNF